MTAAMSPLEPALCLGAVMHARSLPAANRFVYPLFYLRLPLSRLESLSSAMLGIDRPGLMRVDYRDHAARDGSHPLPWIRALLAREGVEAEGEVVLQTMPRVLGYLFNPVSFWFCHDRGGALRAVVCEVNNTFGEHHNYLVARADGKPIANGDVLHTRKVFHVSPFLPVRGEYRFRFHRQGDINAVAIDYWDAGVKTLTTRVSGRAHPLDRGHLTRALARFPLLTVGVVARIHWQALRLWLKRVTFYRKPSPPIEELTR